MYQKTFREVVLKVELVLSATRPLPVLIGRLFDMKLDFSDFDQVIENLNDLGYSLAADVESNSRVVNLQDLLDVNVINLVKSVCLKRVGYERSNAFY